MDLADILDRTAIAVVESGTQSEMPLLTAMAIAAAPASPGAAAALVDWNSSEIARLRAFGIVHGVILFELSDADRSELFAALRGERGLVLAA